MRLGHLPLAASICLVALASASDVSAAPIDAITIGDAAAATSLIDQVQRCRCVERRWNGSCKLRVCRDRWGGHVDSAGSPDESADDDADRSMERKHRKAKSSQTKQP